MDTDPSRRRRHGRFPAAAVVVLVVVAAAALSPTVRADFSSSPPSWPHRSRRTPPPPPPHASVAVVVTRQRRPVGGLATRFGRVAARVATAADGGDGQPAADADRNATSQCPPLSPSHPATVPTSGGMTSVRRKLDGFGGKKNKKKTTNSRVQKRLNEEK